MSEPEAAWVAEALLLTCEHAGRSIPFECREALAAAEELLSSHRGHDIGAYEVALRMVERHRVPLFAVHTSRLVIDANRSLDEASVFSEFTRVLPEARRAEIAARYHAPHREAVRAYLGALVRAERRVLHAGIHSFTDVFEGETRGVDIGLLFDPERRGEAALARGWAERLAAQRPDLRVRLNEPYLGTDDGLTTALRREFPEALYAGIEVEVRQGLIGDRADRCAFGDLLAETLDAALAP